MSTAELEDLIVREFSRRSRASGIRSVVMSELARDLGMSTKTLYRVFSTKEELVERMMTRWASKLGAEMSDEGAPSDPLDAALRTSEVWTEHARSYAAVFWTELERDYPKAWQIYVNARQRHRDETRKHLHRFIRPELPADLAFELLDVMLRRAIDSPALTRREGLRFALDLWAHGALESPEPIPELGRKRRAAAPAGAGAD